MSAHNVLKQITERFTAVIQRTDVPDEGRLFVYVESQAVRELCRYIFRVLDARYVISIGVDDRPFSGQFLVAHNFALDRQNLLITMRGA